MKLLFLLIFLFLSFPGNYAGAEDYPDCRLRCENDYTDCTNAPSATDPEVEAARRASCDLKLQLCYPECENLKPVESTPPENNPNIIRR